MASIKQAFAAQAAITITLDSMVGSSATVGRQSTVVDNTTNLYLDALVFCSLVIPNTVPANDKAAYVYAYGWDGGGSPVYTSSATGSDATITIDNPTTLKLIGVVPVPTQNKTYQAGPFSVAAAFGGVMPGKWGLVVINFTGTTFGAGNAVTYIGVSGTVS